MTADSLLTFALSFHSGLIIVALAAYYKYGDRTELFDKSLRGTDAALAETRRQIAYRLGSRLMTVFDNPDSVIEVSLFDATGRPIEVAVSPAGSEDYNNAIFEFVESDFQVLLDCRALSALRRRWCACARFLSWALLILVALESLIAGALAFWTKYLDRNLPSCALEGAFLFTGLVLVAVVFVPAAILLYLHDRILQHRLRYAAP